MGNDANDIDRIAPTPWTPCGKRQAEDANGLLVFTCSGEMPQVAKRRDRIIACVKFCAGSSTRALNRLLAEGWTAKRFLPEEAENFEETQLPPDIGFAEAAAVVKNHRPE